jgi:hypothetical protein
VRFFSALSKNPLCILRQAYATKKVMQNERAVEVYKIRNDFFSGRNKKALTEMSAIRHRPYEYY